MHWKSSIALVGISFLGAAACDDDPAGPTEGIFAYEDPEFRGEARVFDGNIDDLRDIRGPCGTLDPEGDWNDCISSIRVPSGWEVTIFEDDSYEGGSTTLTSDVIDLEDLNGPCGDDWDDCITAIQVRRR
jgi:hypothetical protein